uniref:Protein ENHANCED DOWNY MILDEW 2-like isoform X1 n=1 Tax=Cicer arietinum TaxID=3827 RepID=A0A3Q7YCY3_CICAR|nr:protein ENHANCED DOWNY MILDEW 2-like isoform X1 [Cicer arietinum]XP_027187835.1 protein ENHANCED DOWNY MILDEW 2-like isoform X1 [Cicer arietinum]XP_027187836.1 protein ENHANCED DOWNY MILDEW 2-like isoform X1 [Cicer arietinum]
MKRRFASLDDETESETDFQSLLVSNYHLEDDDDEPVSFSVLPIQWSDSEISKVNDVNKGHVFLHGSADNGLQKIFMQVTAWRFDISGLKPVVSLLSKDKRWIKLQKPRKSFMDTVKNVLITLYFLHCVKKKPRLSSTSFWSSLCRDRDLSSYGFKPSQKDLLDHMTLIGEATKRDAVLARSKQLLLTVLGDKPEDQRPSDEEFEDLAQPGIIVKYIDNDIIDEANEDSEVDENLFDNVCAFCDNGGNLLCCDGACMRSFHATKQDGKDSFCVSLGLTPKEVDEIQNFYCKNCENRQHQCFACGKLGSSDKDNGAEVFKCSSETCDRFYHPHCVAKLLPKVVKHVAEDLEKNIADGKPFTCPVHFCCVCKGLENKAEPELQFAICNRCPKSYHRKCLPRGIAFDDINGFKLRAWEGLLPNNRILIYCLNHEINDKLGTPVRDHIKFPNTRATVREINTSNKRIKHATKEGDTLKNNVSFVKSSGKGSAKGSKVTGELPSSKIDSKKSSEKINSGSDISRTPISKEIPSSRLTENKNSVSKNSSDKMISCSDISRKPESNKARCLTENKKSISKKSSGNMISGSHISKKTKSNEISRRPLTENKKSISKKFEMPNCEENNHLTGEKLCAPMDKDSEQIKNDDQVDNNNTLFVKPIRSLFPPPDADSEKGLVDSFKEARSSLLLEGKIEKHKMGDVEDKTITMGKREDSGDLTTKYKIVVQENGHVYSDKLASDHIMDGNGGGKLVPNHDLLGWTDDREEPASIKKSQKRSSRNGNVDQESQRGQEYMMSKTWKTSGKRNHGTDKNDRRGLSVVPQAKRQTVLGVPCVVGPLSDCGNKNADQNHGRDKEKHQRESDVGQQVGLSGIQDPNLTPNDHMFVGEPSCSNKNAQLTPASESLDKMNTPAADDLNLVRMRSLYPEIPIFSGNETLNRSVPPGFAAGLNYAFSISHSAGWLDE